MNLKNIVILCTILAILGGGLWYRKQTQTPKGHVQSMHRFAPDLDPASISAVTLTKGNNTISLEKSDIWRVKNLHNAPASSASIEHLLQEIHSLNGELRSDDPAILADYGLDNDSALHMVLRQGDTERLHLLLGKGDFRNVFVRAKDTSAVYVLPGTLLNLAGAQRPNLDPQFWIETSLLNIPLDAITAVSMNTPQYDILYGRKDSGNATAQEWAMNTIRGQGPSEAQIKTGLIIMGRPNVAQVLAPEDPRVAKLAKPTHILMVRTADKEYVLEAVRPDPQADALAKVRGDAFVYTMRSSIFDRIFPDPETEKKMP